MTIISCTYSSAVLRMFCTVIASSILIAWNQSLCCSISSDMFGNEDQENILATVCPAMNVHEFLLQVLVCLLMNT